MAYTYELGTGQRVYLDQQGKQTIVIATSGHAGQQQQSSSSFQTGSWVEPPEIAQVPGGAVVKIRAAQGQSFIHIQGNSMSVTTEMTSSRDFQPMQARPDVETPASSVSSMQPMQPMEPMKMEGMQMSTNSMEMRMGDMEMKMGEPQSSREKKTKRFCSQCGEPIKPSDRFCSSCGHRLS